ncbi:MAG: hypothetical protein PHS77_12730 [Gallionellaceae bacterium]|nr:hypothetical protein [Gallionellaceae bacterium]
MLPNWLFKPFRSRDAMPPEMRQARDLIDAVDAGGVSLNPAKVNAIARALGLEVSRKAPVEDTIRRIRAAVARG